MKTEDFLARVIPPGNFCALAVNREPGTGKPAFYTRMFKDAADAASYAKWATSKGFEIYQAQASYLMAQAEPGKQGNTVYKGSKEAANVAASRAFYLDLDVHRPGDGKHPGQNCFATKQDAAKWLADFTTATGLPRPSLVVSSGYGFHPYWLVDDPLKPADWLVAAHALRAAMVQHGFLGDGGITTDIARILRTPGTVNLKVLADPKPVEVKHAGPSYANADFMAALQPWIGQAQQTAGPQIAQRAGGTVSPLMRGGPAAAFAGSTPTVGSSAAALQTGVAAFSNHHRYEMAKIATKCEQVKESLRTRGNGDSYPLWYSGFLLLSSFATDGDQFITPLSDGDPRFAQQNLDLHWNRLQQEKVAKPDLGPPTCSWMEAARPSVCAACPHRGQIKSPVVLGRDDDDLPRHYRRGIYAIEIETVDEHGAQVWQPVVPGDITDFRLDDDDGPPHVSFRYHRAGRTRTVRFEHHEMLGLEKGRFQGFMALRGIQFPHSTWAHRAKELFVAWVDKMAARASSQGQAATPAFGWVEEHGKITGFAVAGRVFNPDGTDRPSSIGDGKLLPIFGEVGSQVTWRAACDLVIKDRPDLAVLVAASFGSPLMRFSGQSGCFISAISRQSGVGKSSAITVGQAVWGHPTKGINTLYDTFNSVINTIGELRSLPAYWDELRGGKDNSRFVELGFALTQGREKKRLDANAKARDMGSWQTILISASNEPLMEHFVEHTKGTEAGALRLFEYMIEVPPVPVLPGASAVIGACRTNYGKVGRLYARWLAANHAAADVMVNRTIDALNKALGARNDERFHVAAIACVLQGALIANSLGYTQFDARAMKDFLFKAFYTLRRNRARDLVASASGYDLQSILTDFMTGHLERRLVTDKFGTGKSFVRVLQAPPQNRAAHVQVSVTDDTMRINRSSLNLHLRELHISHQGVIDELEKKWGAVVHKAPIGIGTPYTVGHTWVIDVPLAQNGLGDYAIVQGDQK